MQHYSGESGLTYFTQLFVIMLFQFITAATGMAAMAGMLCGSMANPMALNYANDTIPGDNPSVA